MYMISEKEKFKDLILTHGCTNPNFTITNSTMIRGNVCIGISQNDKFYSNQNYNFLIKEELL